MLRKNEKRERSHNNHLQGMRKSQQKYRVGRGFPKKEENVPFPEVKSYKKCFPINFFCQNIGP